MTFAPIGRRFVSLVYEILLLAALLWCASLVFSGIEHRFAETHVRSLFQLYIAVIAGTYFVWQWTHGGQTVPMKTWRLKLVSVDGGAVATRQALIRYVAALAGTLALGLGFIWAGMDRDRQFLHDRIARTRIIKIQTAER
jgi:uncharacterized RDD family membrane protein YckC